MLNPDPIQISNRNWSPVLARVPLNQKVAVPVPQLCSERQRPSGHLTSLLCRAAAGASQPGPELWRPLLIKSGKIRQEKVIIVFQKKISCFHYWQERDLLCHFLYVYWLAGYPSWAGSPGIGWMRLPLTSSPVSRSEWPSYHRSVKWSEWPSYCRSVKWSEWCLPLVSQTVGLIIMTEASQMVGMTSHHR